jgi:hypothetical protein
MQLWSAIVRNAAGALDRSLDSWPVHP